MAKKTLTKTQTRDNWITVPPLSHLSYPALWMVAIPNSQLVFARVSEIYQFSKMAFVLHVWTRYMYNNNSSVDATMTILVILGTGLVGAQMANKSNMRPKCTLAMWAWDCGS